MFTLVKMSSGWYAIEHPLCDTVEQVVEMDGENIESHVSQGSVVAFVDDLGVFADALGISESDITVVEPDDE